MAEWRRFLKADGLLVASEITWLTDSRPAELQKHWEYKSHKEKREMIELPYSLIIEVTEEPDYFGFYSPDLEGFSGIGHSVEDCLFRAKWGMKEHVELLKQEGFPFPPINADPKSTDYRSYCYPNGAFTSPEIKTAADMQKFCIGKLREMGSPGFITWLFTRSIPGLKRWSNT